MRLCDNVIVIAIDLLGRAHSCMACVVRAWIGVYHFGAS